MVDVSSATRWIKGAARNLGFDGCGVCRLGPIGRGDYLRAWLAGGRSGSMAYLHRNLESRLDPSQLLDGAQSAVVAALHYYQSAPTSRDAGTRGRIARYAWGRDYHRVVKGKLHELADAIRERFGDQVQTRACVDTAPIVERELAAKAGVGWIGKNTMVLHPELGSYFVLGVLLTTLELEPDEPIEDHCGSCTACLEACPTDAFPAPYEMDASRCISYLTIEHRGEIPPEFHGPMGDWVFGCDVCQEVCPFNRIPPVTKEPDFAVRPPGPEVELTSILNWSRADYDGNTRGRATRRATLAMWQRNARIVKLNLPAGG